MRSRKDFRRFALVVACLLCACVGSSRRETNDTRDLWIVPTAGPLALARLPDVRWHGQTSADDGSRSAYPFWPEGNLDMSVFGKDCRRTDDARPFAFALRNDTPPCPDFVQGLVMAHAEGPGVVGRIWLTTKDFITGRQWQDERLRVYVDGKPQPVLNRTYAELAAGAIPFAKPYGGLESGSLTSYWGLRYRDEIWITLDNVRAKPYYFQVDLLAGDDQATWAPVPLETKTVETQPVPGTEVVVYDVRGVGAVTELVLTAPTTHADTLRRARLSFAADAVTASATVAELCLAQWVWAPFTSVHVRVDVNEDAVRCRLRWGWPHARHGRIVFSVTDPTGQRVGVSSAVYDRVPEGRFRVASYQHSATEDTPMTWLSWAGDGRLAAWYLAARAEPGAGPLLQDPFAFLEGDERIWLDGEKVLQGTGTEDTFNGGFYFLDGPYSRPWGGLNLRDVDAEGRGRVQMLRTYMGKDVVRFRRSIRGDLEVGAETTAPPHTYHSTAILYVKSEEQ